MKNFNFLLTLSLVCGMASSALAQSATSHPCETIKKACEGAGFVKGQAKEGDGLWVDCIDPIIQGKPQPAKADKKLPSVDPSVVAACKAKNPKFGEHK